MGEVIAITEVQPEERSPADWFDDFWLLYPRHESKLHAKRAWARIHARSYVDILVAAVAWTKIWRAQERRMDCIPYAATWLNGERWEDEIPAELQANTKTHASHVLAVLPGTDGGDGSDSPKARASIPLHVQKVLDQLKGKK